MSTPPPELPKRRPQFKYLTCDCGVNVRLLGTGKFVPATIDVEVDKREIPVVQAQKLLYEGVCPQCRAALHALIGEEE